jgi:hypothetical protein
MINTSEQLSPRESVLLSKETEENRLSRVHAVNMQRLLIEDHRMQLKLKLADAQASRKSLEQRQKAELRTRELESHYSSLYRIPLTLIKLPVYLLFGIAFIIQVAKGKEINSNFWKIL